MNEDYERLKEKLEDLQDRLREVEITLHGKRAKTGLLAEYDRHDELLRRLYAVVWQDPTGQKGLLHDVDLLMQRRSNKEKTVQYKWHFFTAITVAVISAAAALLTNLDKIKAALPKHNPTQYEKRLQKAKHPKGKKIVRVRVLPGSAPTTETERKSTPAPLE